jgi:hypothetical protein
MSSFHDISNIYTTVFQVKRLNHRRWSMKLFNRLTRGKPGYKMICNMKPCNITYRSLIIAWLSESNKTIAQILKCVISRICMYYFIVISCCLHSGIQTIKCSKERNAFMLQCYLLVIWTFSVSSRRVILSVTTRWLWYWKLSVSVMSNTLWRSQ